MNNMQKTPEQQIDEAVESLKALFLPQARNPQESDEIKRRLDSLGYEAKAVSAIVNDRDIYKAAIHKILSQMRWYNNSLQVCRLLLYLKTYGYY